MDIKTVSRRGAEPNRHSAQEFFERIAFPMWQRHEKDISSLDLACAAAVLLDQTIEWIAVEQDTSPRNVREGIRAAEPMIDDLHSVARAIKHCELGHNPHKGHRDALIEGLAFRDGHKDAPIFVVPDGRMVKSLVLLRACSKAIADSFK